MLPAKWPSIHGESHAWQHGDSLLVGRARRRTQKRGLLAGESRPEKTHLLLLSSAADHPESVSMPVCQCFVALPSYWGRVLSVPAAITTVG